MSEQQKYPKCELIEGVGKKSGNTYYGIRITIADGVEKMVFLDGAEKALLIMSGAKFTKVQ